MSDESGPAATESLGRVRRYTWWALVPMAPLLGAVTILVLIVAGGRPWPVTVVLVALAAVVAAAGGYTLHRAMGADRVQLSSNGVRVTAAALVVAMVLDAATGGSVLAWSAMTPLVSGVVAIAAPRGRRSWLIAGGAGLVGLVALVSAGPLGAAIVTFGMLAGGWGILQTWWYFEAARQLDTARLQAAELAVATERLRFAGELHDIQGHHLQVIALRSELAARLATEAPQAAAAAMREVQALAIEALQETRSLVGGYRRVSLGTEIANATRVLAAAEVDTRPRVAAGTDRLGDAERLLGLVVREATTNIIRHAAARRARIELDRVGDTVQLLVGNDGAGDGGTGGGSGLAGLAERLAAVGGTLRWDRHGGEFTVTATVPETATMPETGAGQQTGAGP